MATQTHLMPEDEPHNGSHQDDEEDEGQEHGVLRAERAGWDEVGGMGGMGQGRMGRGGLAWMGWGGMRWGGWDWTG